MLSDKKKAKMLEALKQYKRKFLDKNISDLDESGTRILINHFLSEVLCYSPLEEIKTEFMIRGTYADYVVQVNGERHFLVEVKALALQLSEKHIRQTVNYGANEGIEWALLTNGRTFEFYKIMFSQPIDSVKLFSVELNDIHSLRHSIDLFQFLHRDSVLKEGLKCLSNKCEAMDTLTIAGMLCSNEILDHVRRLIKTKYAERCENVDILTVIHQIISDRIDPTTIKAYRTHRDSKQKNISKQETSVLAKSNDISPVENVPPTSSN